MSQYLDKDGASRIAENFLSKQAEQDAILANLQFDLKEAEHALVKTIQGPAPLNIRALTRPLDNYVISGNTTQNGTPTPEAPVDVVGCGVRTANLYNSAETDWELGILDDNGNNTGLTTSHYTKNFTAVEPETSYYLSGTIYIGQSGHRIYYYDASKNWISRSTLIEYNNGKFTTPANCKYVRFQIIVDLESTSDWMLSTGSTSKPYEPYGYKLPPTVNGTEYPIYLGQVPTTRQIKKLVLTGEENITSGHLNQNLFNIPINDYLIAPIVSLICTHYRVQQNAEAWSEVSDGNACFYVGNVAEFKQLYIRDSSYSTIAAFKSYLAAQYAAGTPVTVWYVMSDPETGIVNEPLHKIGDYEDTISYAQSGVTLTTTKGFNTITTDTTVLPSNIEVKGVINNA